MAVPHSLHPEFQAVNWNENNLTLLCLILVEFSANTNDTQAIESYGPEFQNSLNAAKYSIWWYQEY
jgi:hypothetical protein